MDFKKMKKEEIVKEYNTLKKQFDSLNADMEGTLQALQAKEAEIADYKTAIKSKSDEITSRDEEIERLTSKVNQCKDEINETVCKLQEARKQVVNLSEEHKSLQAYLDSLKDKTTAFNVWKYSAIVLGIALLISICIMFA